MLKHKAELIIVIILIPILAYVGWQAYNSYFKPSNVEELEKAVREEPARPAPQPVAEQPQMPSVPKGTLDYTGFTERDPLKASLPIKEKIEKPIDAEKPPEEKPEEIPIQVEPPKIIVLPTFKVAGIVWGQSPRVIIDDNVYKTGDIVKGAKILDITHKGIQMIYEGKEFWVTL